MAGGWQEQTAHADDRAGHIALMTPPRRTHLEELYVLLVEVFWCLAVEDLDDLLALTVILRGVHVARSYRPAPA